MERLKNIQTLVNEPLQTSVIIRIATAQRMQGRKIKILQGQDKSGNFILSQGKFTF